MKSYKADTSSKGRKSTFSRIVAWIHLWPSLSCEDCQAQIIDRYTGLPIDLSRSAALHEVVENTYWTLHMGTRMGQLGKFVTFTGGLITTSLPITGFLIWWGRRKKKKPAAKKRSLPQQAHQEG